ncbi:MAG: isocitrate lyase/PEP mutase family protein [Gemmataceae bacterium]
MSQAASSVRATGGRPTWKELLARGRPLLLPAAHDALTAKLIERAGFDAVQVGGFALDGTQFGFPDIDLTHFGDKAPAVQRVLGATALPALVDGDDGYGDVKNVTRTVGGYEAIGAAAVFIEDQQAPKSCGQEGSKQVIPDEEMVGKIEAARAARRNPDTFLLIRTDARSAHGVAEAIRRAEVYRDAGADGVYVEGLRSARELKRVGKALAGTPLATTLMEGGGDLPWLPPEEIYGYGFSMILYPTTVLFRLAKAIERAVADLKAGKPMPEREAMDREGFEQAIGKPVWTQIEKRFKR